MWTLVLTGLFLDHVTCLGTTPDVEEVIIGRCNDYDKTRYTDLLPRVPTPCHEIWTKFSSAFAYKGPCNVPASSYLPFFEAAKQVLPENKIMFWSGTYHLAHLYAKEVATFITLEDTLIGYLADTLEWCGQVNPPGINYTVCPSDSECPDGAIHGFWSSASKALATSAKGNVTLMVNGSNPDKPAYRKNSYFAQYELPNLNASLVPAMNVILVHALGLPKLETCTSGSLLTLKEDATKIGLQYTCVDNPVSVLHLLCADEPNSRECKFAADHCGLESGAIHAWISPQNLGFSGVILGIWVLFSKL
ncbi:hypothetical protein Btru_055856 [Bulinus truncatus]|nr:hypothetical protein Btru_055856 [Bulinus truncatus]